MVPGVTRYRRTAGGGFFLVFLFVLERFYSPIPLFSKGFWQAKRKKSPQKIEEKMLKKKQSFLSLRSLRVDSRLAGGERALWLRLHYRLRAPLPKKQKVHILEPSSLIICQDQLYRLFINFFQKLQKRPRVVSDGKMRKSEQMDPFPQCKNV